MQQTGDDLMVTCPEGKRLVVARGSMAFDFKKDQYGVTTERPESNCGECNSKTL